MSPRSLEKDNKKDVKLAKEAMAVFDKLQFPDDAIKVKMKVQCEKLIDGSRRMFYLLDKGMIVRALANYKDGTPVKPILTTEEIIEKNKSANIA